MAKVDNQELPNEAIGYEHIETVENREIYKVFNTDNKLFVALSETNKEDVESYDGIVAKHVFTIQGNETASDLINQAREKVTMD